jgi:hypothetical protein
MSWFSKVFSKKKTIAPTGLSLSTFSQDDHFYCLRLGTQVRERFVEGVKRMKKDWPNRFTKCMNSNYIEMLADSNDKRITDLIISAIHPSSAEAYVTDTFNSSNLSVGKLKLLVQMLQNGLPVPNQSIDMLVMKCEELINMRDKHEMDATMPYLNKILSLLNGLRRSPSHSSSIGGKKQRYSKKNKLSKRNKTKSYRK